MIKKLIFLAYILMKKWYSYISILIYTKLKIKKSLIIRFFTNFVTIKISLTIITIKSFEFNLLLFLLLFTT